MPFLSTVKTITNKAGNLIFNRFAIFQCSFFAVYIHTLYAADKDPFPHNHPWNFLSLILDGGYYEELVTNKKPYTTVLKLRKRGSFAFYTRKAHHKIAQLIDPSKPTVTLFFTFGKRKDWHYLTPQGEEVSNEDFREKKDEIMTRTTKQ